MLFTLIYGDIPEDYCIDHINGNRKDNQLSNLRAVKAHENAQNQTCHRKGKIVGGTYVKKHGKWQAYIQRNNVRIFLGLFETAQDANTAYKNFDKRSP